MKAKAKSNFLLLLFWLFTYQVQAQIGEIVFSFPSPANNPTGLAWDGEYLWNADSQTNRIYRIDPTNGDSISSILGPAGATMNGLTWDGNSLWCSDNASSRLYKLNPVGGEVEKTISIQSSSLRGLAFDGEYLWCQDSEEKRIYKFDPITETILDTLVAPGGYNRGLAWDGFYLWSSDRAQNEIYKVDPKRDCVIQILSVPCQYSYGLAFDGEYIYNADYSDQKIYKISIRGTEKFKVWDPMPVNIRYTVKLKNVGSGTMDLKTYFACPYETSYQTLEESLQFLNPPHDFFADKYEQRIAYYRENVSPGEEKVYGWSVPATLLNVRYFLDPDSVGTLDQIPPSIIEMYTTDGDYYKITYPYIKAAVHIAIGDESNLYWQVRKIHDYIISKIEYVNDNQWDDAPTVLNQGYGSCSEYSFLFISMCRAAGIPARYEAGGHLRDDIPYEDRVFHRWQQVYFPNYGWVPIDCTWDDKSYPSNQARYFGALSNTSFSTTLGGGGDTGLWWSYNSANSSSGGTREREKLMEWLPFSTEVDITVNQVPTKHQLSFNYPNPFNSQTIIKYFLTKSDYIKISIFNQMGQRIRHWDEGFCPSGWHSKLWDAKHTNGEAISSGIYFYKIEGNQFRQTGQMTNIQ